MPYQSRIKLEIFNVLGQRVALLVDEIVPAGYRSAVWNGKSDYGLYVSSGVYIYRIEAEAVDEAKKFASMRKMVLIK